MFAIDELDKFVENGLAALNLRQEPKSAKRMWPQRSSRMLSGLMSLCGGKKEGEGRPLPLLPCWVLKLEWRWERLYQYHQQGLN